MNSNQISEALSHYFQRLSLAVSGLDIGQVSELANQLLKVQKLKGKVWLIGNGGSASTASHMAVDLMFGILLGQRIQAISLVDNSASLTATGNDVSFEEVFSRQVEQVAQPGDLLIAISASGNSQNLIKAINVAKELGIRTSALVAFDGGKMLNLVDYPVHVKTEQGDYGVAEDAHLAINHAIKEALNSLIRSGDLV